MVHFTSHRWNPAVEYNLFSEEQRGEGQKQTAITLKLWRAWRLVFSCIWIRVEKYTGQNVAKENVLSPSILKFVQLSSRIWSCNIPVYNICIYGCFLRKLASICQLSFRSYIGQWHNNIFMVHTDDYNSSIFSRLKTFLLLNILPY